MAKDGIRYHRELAQVDECVSIYMALSTPTLFDAGIYLLNRCIRFHQRHS